MFEEKLDDCRPQRAIIRVTRLEPKRDSKLSKLERTPVICNDSEMHRPFKGYGRERQEELASLHNTHSHAMTGNAPTC